VGANGDHSVPDAELFVGAKHFGGGARTHNPRIMPLGYHIPPPLTQLHGLFGRNRWKTVFISPPLIIILNVLCGQMTEKRNSFLW